MLLVFTNAASALDPTRQISQYGHTAWRVQDGAFSGTPQAIAQTADGYVWIGTNAGLIRFDGVRFVPWVPPAGPALPSSNVVSLLAARDGSLWIGTANGPAHLKNQKAIAFPHSGRINAIIEDGKGEIWIARSRILNSAGGPFCRVKASGLECYGYVGTSSTASSAEALAQDGTGGFWIGTVPGVWHWKQGVVTRYFPKLMEHADGSAGVLALAVEGAIASRIKTAPSIHR